MRIERKFVIPEYAASDVRLNLKISPLGFRKQYRNRLVRSLYFDNFNHANYSENLAGVINRSKVRLRWYPNHAWERPSQNTEFFLECKLKNGRLGEKLISMPKIPFGLSTLTSTRLLNLLRDQLAPEVRPYMDYCSEASLLVVYQREYYEDFNRDIRVTIDTKLNYSIPKSLSPLNNLEDGVIDTDYCVVEIKHEDKLTESQDFLMGDLVGVSPGRHSKYSVGSFLVHTR